MKSIEKCEFCFKFKFFDNWIKLEIEEIVNIIIDPGINIVMSICPECISLDYDKND